MAGPDEPRWTTGGCDSEHLLDACRLLLNRDDWALSHWWSRGAAHLARQAMETLLDEYWEVKMVVMTRASTRAKFLALHASVQDASLVRDGYATWSQLSRSCHYHPYDLAPTIGEVQGWVAAAAVFCDGLRAEGARPDF
jgi:cytochrome c5